MAHDHFDTPRRPPPPPPRPLDLEKADLLYSPPPSPTSPRQSTRPRDYCQCLRVRRIARLIRRRPLLSLIALGTCTITAGILYLGFTDPPESTWTYLSFNDATSADAAQEPRLPHYLTDPLDQTVPPQMMALAGLQGECLEAWVARGEICKPGPALDLLQKSMLEAIPIDAVWTWVNGR